jgi:hypothetical protein
MDPGAQVGGAAGAGVSGSSAAAHWQRGQCERAGRPGGPAGSGPAPAMPGRAGTCTGATKGGHCDDPTQPGHTAGVPVPVARRARKPTQAPAKLIRLPDQGGAYGDSSWANLRRAST